MAVGHVDAAVGERDEPDLAAVLRPVVRAAGTTVARGVGDASEMHFMEVVVLRREVATATGDDAALAVALAGGGAPGGGNVSTMRSRVQSRGAAPGAVERRAKPPERETDAGLGGGEQAESRVLHVGAGHA